MNAPGNRDVRLLDRIISLHPASVPRSGGRNWELLPVPPEGIANGASTLIDVAVDSDDNG